VNWRVPNGATRPARGRLTARFLHRLLCRHSDPRPAGHDGTTLGNIKTAIAGTYHHVSAKHAQAYLTSFAYRFNRRYQLNSIVERLAWAAIHTIPQPYRIVTADA
jgi:hypothetical protein